jgi:hypothetical protein
MVDTVDILTQTHLIPPLKMEEEFISETQSKFPDHAPAHGSLCGNVWHKHTSHSSPEHEEEIHQRNTCKILHVHIVQNPKTVSTSATNLTEGLKSTRIRARLKKRIYIYVCV